MINNYEIKNIKGEEILYIYIDDSYEFSRINKGKKRKNFLEMISNFIKDKEVKFAGSTIALITGGLVIGNLFLNNTNDLDFKNCIVSLHINPQIVDAEVLNEEFIDKTTINIEVENTIFEEDKKTNEVKDEIIKENESIDTNQNIKVVTKENVSNNPVVEIKEENVKNKIEEKEITEAVTVFRTNGEVLMIEMEEYLVNVVAAEMPASFNIEALKAQSVLARTYARKAINSGKVLTDSISTQVYKDDNELKSMWGNDYIKYYDKIKNAVLSTSGEVLKYNENYIEAVYHSTSNGFTEDPVNVWGNSFPYLKVVESSVDKITKNFFVTTFFSYSKISDSLGFIFDNSTNFNIIEKNSSSRVSKVTVNDNTYTGVQFRNLLGLRSADFDFEKVHNGINITTRGYGHGVGMSQYGANELAKNGMSYQQILNHYYSGTSLVKE